MNNKKRLFYLFSTGLLLTSFTYLSSRINPPSAPGRPEISEIYSNCCTLTYKAPLSDGGSPIKSYYIEKRNINTTVWEKVDYTNYLNYKATNLIEGEIYVFRVAAANIVGYGPFSGSSNPIMAQDPFNK